MAAAFCRVHLLPLAVHAAPNSQITGYDSAYQLNRHNKYLLMAPSLDRSAEIGFRTAADAPPEAMTGE
jgi:hypothetical protein